MWHLSRMLTQQFFRKGDDVFRLILKEVNRADDGRDFFRLCFRERLGRFEKGKEALSHDDRHFIAGARRHEDGNERFPPRTPVFSRKAHLLPSSEPLQFIQLSYRFFWIRHSTPRHSYSYILQNVRMSLSCDGERCEHFPACTELAELAEREHLRSEIRRGERLIRSPSTDSDVRAVFAPVELLREVPDESHRALVYRGRFHEGIRR